MISVLYVDDEPELLEIGRIFLEESRDFSVTVFTSAKEALESPVFRSFDVIVSDYQMPEMNGIAFLQEIRSRYGTIPFILFTGRGREEIVIQAINLGADFYLQKGGEPEAQFAELAHKIRVAVERRHTIDALQDSERRLADIINFLPDATFAIDRAGTVIAWNRAIEEMTGVMAADILGKGNYEYAIPFYQARRKILIDLIFERDDFIAKNYAHIIHDKDILIADTTLPRPRGRARTLAGKASPLYNRQGEIVGAIESIRDITELKQVEEELRASEEKYRVVVENSQDGIYIYRNNEILFANSRAATMTGYTHEELMGLDVWSLVHPEDRGPLRESGLRRISGEPLDPCFSARIVTKSGSIRDCEFFVDRIIFQGQPAILGLVRDVTDRKRAEVELRTANEQLTASEEEMKGQLDVMVQSEQRARESEEKFRTLFNNISDAVYIHETGADGSPGGFMEVNEIMCTRLGYSRDELLNLTIRDIVTDAHRTKMEEIRRQIQATGQHTFYAEHRRRDGSVFPVEVNAHRFVLNGRPVVLSVARDITEQKREELALRETNTKLHLLSSITRHDIANQILILRGYAQLAQTRTGNPAVLGLLEKILRAAGNVDGQIEFIRSYRDLGIQSPSWIRLDAVVSGIVPECTVTISPDCRAIEIYADPLFERVFYNLFENAARHGGHVTEITVRCAREAEDLVVIVEDNGQGIPADKKEMIFQYGFGNNTGLGLFLAREILAITKIAIRETGVPGAGARFELLVPGHAFRISPRNGA